MRLIKEKSTYIDKEMKYLLGFIRRWEKKHPDEELVFITLPKYEQKERKRILQAAIELADQERFSENTKNT